MSSAKKSKRSKTPSNSKADFVEEVPKKETPRKKSAIAEETPKKETPKNKSPVVEGFFLLDSLKTQEGEKIQTETETETQDSLLNVLTQALQNNDVAVLDQCFGNQDNDIIENTVKKLPQNKILALFEKIGDRIENGKKSNYNFLAWLSSLVRNHSTFLLKLPEISTNIAPLITLLQKRTVSVDQIHRLKGKIDMVLNVDTDVFRTKKTQRNISTSEQKGLIIYGQDEEGENIANVKKTAKGGKKPGYTKAMEELEGIEGVEARDFEEEGEEDMSEDENGDYDAYLDEGGQDFDEGGEDDNEDDFDEEEEGDDDEEDGIDME